MVLRLNGNIRGDIEKYVLLGNGSSSKVVNTTLKIFFDIRERIIFDLKDKEIFSDEHIEELVNICYEENFYFWEDINILEPKIKEKIRKKSMNNEDISLQKELGEKIKNLSEIQKLVIFTYFIKISENPFIKVLDENKKSEEEIEKLSLRYYTVFLQKMFSSNFKNNLEGYEKVYKELLEYLEIE